MQVDLAGFCGKRVFIDIPTSRSGQNRYRSFVKRPDTSRNRLDTEVRPIDLSNDVVLRVGDEEVPLCVEGQTFRLIETGRGGHRPITGPACGSGTGDGPNQSSVEIRLHLNPHLA